MMTKKDYQRIARAIDTAADELLDRASRQDGMHRRAYMEAVGIVSRHIANELQLDNPRFNRDRFNAAALGMKEDR